MPSWSLLDEVEDTFAHITTNAVASDARSLCASSASRNHVHPVFVAMALARAMRSYFGMNNYHPMSSMLSNAESPSSQPFVDFNYRFGCLFVHGPVDLNARCRSLHPPSSHRAGMQHVKARFSSAPGGTWGIEKAFPRQIQSHLAIIPASMVTDSYQ
jgi:hypothetical protein